MSNARQRLVNSLEARAEYVAENYPELIEFVVRDMREAAAALRAPAALEVEAIINGWEHEINVEVLDRDGLYRLAKYTIVLLRRLSPALVEDKSNG